MPVVGAKGEQGLQGPQGLQGERGEQGQHGQQGERGERGEQGQHGQQGERGQQGEQGLPGLQGAPGQQGWQGAQGPKGDNGLQGQKGDTGPQGQKGDAGPQGQKGDAGPSGPVTVVSSSQLITYKIGKFVSPDVDVNLGNLNVRIGSDVHNLMVSAVSGTYSVYGNCTYIISGQGWAEIKSSSPLVITNEPVLLARYPNFTSGGNSCSWLLMDTNTCIAWRIYLIVGDNYVNNFISIEQLS